MSNGKRNRNSNNNQQRRRRSGGRGGQKPRGPAMTALGESTYEAVFDHGDNGYGVWFDGVVRDDPMYKQFWKGTGTRPLFVQIEENQIVLRKELDRDLPPINNDADSASATETADDTSIDLAIEEAVAEALKTAELVAEPEEETPAAEEKPKRKPAAKKTSKAKSDPAEEEVVYSPEEAARLFAQEPIEESAAEEEKPKRKRATRRKKAADEE